MRLRDVRGTGPSGRGSSPWDRTSEGKGEAAIWKSIPRPARPQRSITMPTLYYSPTSCGKASFIAAFITGCPINVEKVDIQKHLTASGEDFYAINPKGAPPPQCPLWSGTPPAACGSRYAQWMIKTVTDAQWDRRRQCAGARS